jgi:hypothetical protein
MTTSRQGDLFASAGVADRTAEETPDPDLVRRRLYAVLALVRDASQIPWEPPRARAQELLFWNMAAWLGQDEREA